MLFFSNSEIVDNNDLTNRYKNASIFVVIMLLLMLITGAGVKVLVNMIEIGLIMFLVAQWLDS